MKCINNIIIETENAIRCMEPKWQNIYRFQAKKLIKQITEKHKQNPLHRHQQNVIRKLKMELSKEDIIIMKADKNKTMVLIDSNQCKEKVNTFLRDNNIPTITNDPTNKFHKQIQKVTQPCPQLIDKKTHKYLTQMEPRAPVLNTLIKTHKANMPIRPVINNTHAPAHKLAALRLHPFVLSLERVLRNSTMLNKVALFIAVASLWNASGDGVLGPQATTIIDTTTPTTTSEAVPTTAAPATEIPGKSCLSL